MSDERKKKEKFDHYDREFSEFFVSVIGSGSLGSAFGMTGTLVGLGFGCIIGVLLARRHG